MPRTMACKQFVIMRLRHIASNKKASPATQLRALDRLATIEQMYEVTMKDQEPESGERPENLSGPRLDDKVQSMLDRARRRGGDDANKLPESSA